MKGLGPPQGVPVQYRTFETKDVAERVVPGSSLPSAILLGPSATIVFVYLMSMPQLVPAGRRSHALQSGSTAFLRGDRLMSSAQMLHDEIDDRADPGRHAWSHEHGMERVSVTRIERLEKRNKAPTLDLTVVDV